MVRLVGGGGGGSTGNFTFTSSNIDTDDSSGITVIPSMTVQSDLTVQNDLVVNNTVRANKFVSTAAGVPKITSSTNIELNATNRVLITDTVFRLASMTTTQRNAVASPVNGDMIYNSTTNQLESYENSAWVATKGTSSGIGGRRTYGYDKSRIDGKLIRRRRQN